ncbi:cardiolipin synthase ClsB [Pseudomonas luteola]|uniref:cardiolipin synthase ClsB n=1 Tax=Pseudomonas TaxID=286 RepID=UPI00123B65B8|nr:MULTISPECIES: cardiolipin synthase ClsB [Pseudomonas]MBA1247472.1 cardiolipin synthase ClsB [Pseudomonas zeshuii]QEU29015.1 cardiolipin synthase ClsB [Pseudomonas luteola]
MNPQWRDGNRIELLENGEEYFPRVFEAISQAKREILLETFILFEDKVGNELHRVLIEAARRGVRVEVTVDGYGSAELTKDFLDKLVLAGVRFRFYDPRPLFMGRRTNLFRRLHRKIVVIDAEIAFVGGINFSADHLGDFGPTAKQDYAVEVEGPIVADIHRFSLEALGNSEEPRRWWGRRRNEPARNDFPGDAQALFVYRDNDEHRTDIEQHYIEMMRSAKREIIIANAYFFPGYRLLRELRDAARRGVKVRLIVQGEPDMPIVKVGARMLYNYLVPEGVEVYEYCRRPLHGKVALMDDYWATVGSSNLDPLSLSLNLESNLIFHDRAFNQVLRGRLEQLMAQHCQHVDMTKVPRKTIWHLAKTMLVFHFLRHFPAWVGWLPAHTPKIALVEPPAQSHLERSDVADPERARTHT